MRTWPDRADVGAAHLDADSARWVSTLTATGQEKEAAIARLHRLLLRIAQGETRRRGRALRVAGPELDDLAYQAAADALLAIIAKVSEFRGDSRFTTWAHQFVVFEVSAKVGRHFWRTPSVPMAAEDWAALPDPTELEPGQQSEWRELTGALRRAADEELSPRQRQVFVAVVLNGVPLDTVAAELGSSRNAVYKTMFDARRKLRRVLTTGGFLDPDAAGGHRLLGRT